MVQNLNEDAAMVGYLPLLLPTVTREPTMQKLDIAIMLARHVWLLCLALESTVTGVLSAMGVDERSPGDQPNWMYSVAIGSNLDPTCNVVESVIVPSARSNHHTATHTM